MFNYDLATPYSLACALLPCLILLVLHRQDGIRWQRLWAVLFCCYLWQVYDLTGSGGLSDIFLQLRIFAELGIHSLGELIDVLQTPDGPLVFRSRLNLLPLQNLSTGFLLNIALFLPFGYLLPMLWRGHRSLRSVALSGAAFSLLIECSQLLTSRACDIDDLIANTLGAVLGYFSWWFFGQLFGKHLRQTPSGRREPWLLMAASFTGMFLFYHPFWFYTALGI